MIITINSMDFMLPTLCHLQLAPLMTTRSISLSWHLIFVKVWENNRDSGTQLAIFETKPFSTLRKLQKSSWKRPSNAWLVRVKTVFEAWANSRKSVHETYKPGFGHHWTSHASWSTPHRISEYQNGPSPFVRPPCSSPNSPNWCEMKGQPFIYPGNHLGMAKWIT